MQVTDLSAAITESGVEVDAAALPPVASSALHDQLATVRRQLQQNQQTVQEIMQTAVQRISSGERLQLLQLMVRGQFLELLNEQQESELGMRRELTQAAMGQGALPPILMKSAFAAESWHTEHRPAMDFHGKMTRYEMEGARGPSIAQLLDQNLLSPQQATGTGNFGELVRPFTNQSISRPTSSLSPPTRLLRGAPGDTEPACSPVGRNAACQAPLQPHASRLQPFAHPGELPVLMDASRGGGSTPMSRVTATGKSPAMPQTEEEEEADARDDGQSSSHASHNGDGGAYGNSAGSIGPTPRSGGRSNQHSNRSNPGTAQGRPHVAALQGLKQQQQRRQSNEVLGHNRRAAHSNPHRGPGGSGPGSRVNSRPPSVGHLPSGRLPQVVGRGGQRPAASSSAVQAQQRVRRFNGQQPAMAPAAMAPHGRVTPTLGSMAVGGVKQQRVQALGQAYNQGSSRRPPPSSGRQQPGPPQRRSGGPALMGGPGTAPARRLTPTLGRGALTPAAKASGQQPVRAAPATDGIGLPSLSGQQPAVNRTHQRTS